MRRLTVLAMLVYLAGGLASCFAQDDVVMRAMRDELDRSMKQLQLEKLDKPYFIAYRVNDRTVSRVSSTLGSLTASRHHRTRMLSVEIRVGDYGLDNTNFLSFDFGPAGVTRGFGNSARLSLEDDYKEIRRQIWLATDAAYKRALQDLARKQAALKNKTRGDDVPDFSKEEPATWHEIPASWDFDPLHAEDLVRELSKLFQAMPDIYRSSVELEASNDYSRYVNSEGTEFTRALPQLSLVAHAGTQAIDGMPLADGVAVYARSMRALPSEEQIGSQIKELGARLAGLRTAPLVDRYNGPVLFEGQAAAEIFNQTFALRLVASRRPIADTPQFEMALSRWENPFQARLAARVLPEWAGMVDDATRQEENQIPLLGGYAVDDDGVRTRKSVLVENGVLKSLLTSRSPVRGLPHSTGNDRTLGVAPSNLFLTAKNGLSDAAIKEKLLSLAQQRGKPYAIVVRRLTNPWLGDPQEMMSSMAGLFMPGLGGGSGVTPSAVLAYEVFSDGHEKLIRSAQLEGMNEASFKDLVAASASETVYSTPFLDIGNTVTRMFSGGLPPGEVQPPIVSLAVPNLVFEEVTVNPPSREIPKLPLSRPPLGM